jgi:hypothetical protein
MNEPLKFDQAGRADYRIDHEADPSTYLLSRNCPLCGRKSRVVIPAQGLWDWEHGKFAQDAFPALSADDRELVISGIHAQCWEDLMGSHETLESGAE